MTSQELEKCPKCSAVCYGNFTCRHCVETRIERGELSKKGGLSILEAIGDKPAEPPCSSIELQAIGFEMVRLTNLDRVNADGEIEDDGDITIFPKIK